VDSNPYNIAKRVTVRKQSRADTLVMMPYVSSTVGELGNELYSVSKVVTAQHVADRFESRWDEVDESGLPPRSCTHQAPKRRAVRDERVTR
jgi:hypothetical protein